MNAHTIEVHDQSFEAEVIERSKQVPVVVDFWAPWCGPCQALGPILERLADEYAGAFVLAKVNTDESPRVAQAFGVQSIPLVLGFREGQVVSEFLGALPEPAIRDFLARVLPSDADRLALSAEEMLLAGKTADAEAMANKALGIDPRNGHALLTVARIRADRQELNEALGLLDRISPGPLRKDADRLAAEIRITQAGGGDEQTLRAKVDANPNDLETRLLLAQALAVASKYDDALEAYLEVVRRDRGFQDGAARKAMLDIFSLLGSGNPTVEHFRSELAKVLFS